MASRVNVITASELERIRAQVNGLGQTARGGGARAWRPRFEALGGLTAPATHARARA